MQAVLRVGEAHRQTVRTGTTEMSDMPDDALQKITEALGNGNRESACRAARKWCDLAPRHRAMCRDGGDTLWNELTTRIFGANSVGVADHTDAQKNFYELCRRAVGREAALKWTISHRNYSNFIFHSTWNRVPVVPKKFTIG